MLKNMRKFINVFLNLLNRYICYLWYLPWLRVFPIFDYAWIVIFIKNCLDLILKELLLDNIPTSESRMFKLWVTCTNNSFKMYHISFIIRYNNAFHKNTLLLFLILCNYSVANWIIVSNVFLVHLIGVIWLV